MRIRGWFEAFSVRRVNCGASFLNGASRYCSQRPSGSIVCRSLSRTLNPFFMGPSARSMSPRAWNRQRALEEIARVDPASGQERAELAQAACFDLADALARQPEPAADGLEAFGLLALEAEAAPQHGTLVGGQIVEHGHEVGALAEEGREGAARVRRRIGDEIAHAAFLAHGRLQRQGLLADLLELLELLHRGRPLQRLGEPLLLFLVAPEQEPDVHRQADGPCLVRQRAHDRLANPPGRVRRESRAARAVELLDRAQQTDVALLDQIR